LVTTMELVELICTYILIICSWPNIMLIISQRREPMDWTQEPWLLRHSWSHHCSSSSRRSRGSCPRFQGP
jgi:hypothetical protein